VKRLEGHHAVVTGGGTGIGAAIARALAAEGAKLTLVGRRRDKLEEVASGDFDALVAPADVTVREELERAFALARDAQGSVSILVINAGIGDSAPFGRTTREAWDRIIATNLSAAFDCAQLGLSDLLAAEHGRLVFVASVAGLRGAAYAAPYAASKHGVVGLMRSMAEEFAKSTMTVNAVCPSFVDTPMVQEAAERIARVTGRSDEESRTALADINRHGRLVRPEAVATMVVTLCLPQSQDVNGAAVPIDGGTIA
jgi:NAD(P)-dependent dehydrogenase (short-subunit alcohol dehydrogenase family)